MKSIDTIGFEKLFQRNSDPWNYARSPFEIYKRKILMNACGAQCIGAALELACANGQTSNSLSSRCLRLLAIDASPTALAVARRHVSASRVQFCLAKLPSETPRGSFNLIVASEILYYLPRREMELLIRQLICRLAPGGRIVLVHHQVYFDDAAQLPWRAQAIARHRLGRVNRIVHHVRHRRYDIVAYRRPFRRRQDTGRRHGL